MVVYSVPDDIINNIISFPSCLFCEKQVDHENYSNSCTHLKLAFSTEEDEPWYVGDDKIKKDLNVQNNDLYQYIEKLDDSYLTIKIVGFSFDIFFVFNHE